MTTKVAFIICVNDISWFEECKIYINNLIIPKGITKEIIPIWNATSMANGYNRAIKLSSAKYKIYMHQDVFIINKNLITDILSIFRQNSQIGIIGMVGANDIQNDKVSWDRWEYGKLFGCSGTQELYCDFGAVEESYIKVDCVDGMLIATQYDIPWRDDIFDGWHFYDRSICIENLKRGYITVVAKQNIPWCIHDCGASELLGWKKYLKIFLDEYSDLFSENCIYKSLVAEIDESERKCLSIIANDLEILINKRKIVEAAEILYEVASLSVFPNKKIIFISELLNIYEFGSSNVFFLPNETVEEMYQKYTKAKFIFRRIAYKMLVTQEEINYIGTLNECERKAIILHNLGQSLRRKNDVI